MAIDGVLDLTFTAPNTFQVSGILFSSGFDGPGRLTIGVGGAIRVTGGNNANAAHGIYGVSGTLDILNRGVIEIVDQNAAIGVTSFDPDVLFENTGVIRATAGSYARGVWLGNNSAFVNSGTIEAVATAARDSNGFLSGTTAVMIGRFQADIVNSGLVRANTGADRAATAMDVSGGGNGRVLLNSGRLEGNTALFVSSNGFQIQRVVNTGTLAGEVQLRGNAFRFENSGVVTGAVQLSLGDDIYDGVSGALGAALRAGDGADYLAGGAGGEFLLGESGDDTILGAAGDDTLVGGAGADRLDGGDGLDTLSYETAAASVTVNLDAGTASGDGSDAITGFERIVGSRFDDVLRGGFGADTVSGGGGADTINGGAGANYLRGDEGDDSIVGGSGFDDANGNQGADTVSTGAGEDYCVGGKDNDVLSGGADYDLVYGNLGDDTCDGDDGNDIVRGGQGNDVVRGGGGDDFVSGDKGDDTMTGGAGADIFHTFGDAGIDRVTDFDLAQGDRVQLDPGTQFTVSQVGADTVISMSGGGQMILVGVAMSSLTGAWIFGA